MSGAGGTSSFFIVDDHDIQSINYDSQDDWFQSFNNQAYSGTITSGIAGAKASLTFSGTAVGVVGLTTTVQNTRPPAVRFSIDGVVVQTTTAPNSGPDNFSFIYLDQENLDSTSHLLEIDVLNATANYPFVMDYVLYLPVEGAAPTASQSVVTTFLPAPSGSSAPQGVVTSKSSVPVGPIVGGVIGGVAVIVAACIAIWFLYFRHRRSNGRPTFYATTAAPGDLLDENEIKATPYEDYPPSVAPASTFRPGSQYQPGGQSATSPQPAPSAYSASTPSHYTAPSGLGHGSQSAYTPSELPVSDYSSGSGHSAPSTLILASGSTPRVRTSPNQSRSKAAEAGLLSVPQETTFHADSGVRFDANGKPIPAASSSSSANILAPPAELSDVPPSYTPA